MTGPYNSGNQERYRMYALQLALKAVMNDLHPPEKLTSLAARFANFIATGEVSAEDSDTQDHPEVNWEKVAAYIAANQTLKELVVALVGDKK